MGQTAYFGPAIDSLAHFVKLGHVPDGMVNPADYLLEVCQFLIFLAITLFHNSYLITAAEVLRHNGILGSTHACFIFVPAVHVKWYSGISGSSHARFILVPAVYDRVVDSTRQSS